MSRISAFFLVLLIAAQLEGAPKKARPYHLELEASPSSVFPFLGRFGKVTLHVYQSGVRAETLWLHSFSRNDAPDVTVVNPLGRMYVDIAISEISTLLRKLGSDGVAIKAKPRLQSQAAGKVGGIVATRHRLSYGKDAWVDVWTTDVIAENPHMRQIVDQLVEGISPGTAEVARKLPGTPVYVEMNFSRFKKVPLVKFKKLTFDPEAEQGALTLGSLYVKAPMIEKLWEK